MTLFTVTTEWQEIHLLGGGTPADGLKINVVQAASNAHPVYFRDGPTEPLYGADEDLVTVHETENHVYADYDAKVWARTPFGAPVIDVSLPPPPASLLTPAQAIDIAKIDEIIPDAGSLVDPQKGFIKDGIIYINPNSVVSGITIAMPTPRTVANITAAGFVVPTDGVEVNDTGPFTGAAPAGVLLGVDRVNNKLFKVVAGFYVEIPLAPDFRFVDSVDNQTATGGEALKPQAGHSVNFDIDDGKVVEIFIEDAGALSASLTNANGDFLDPSGAQFPSNPSAPSEQLIPLSVGSTYRLIAFENDIRVIDSGTTNITNNGASSTPSLKDYNNSIAA